MLEASRFICTTTLADSSARLETVARHFIVAHKINLIAHGETLQACLQLSRIIQNWQDLVSFSL